MSQAKVVKKFQSGTSSSGLASDNDLIFKVDGKEFKVKENEFDSFYTQFLKEVGPKAKNVNDWDQDFSQLKSTIKKGQQSGNYFNFDLSADRAIKATSDMPITEAQAGKNKKGRGIKPGFLSSVTGTQREGARMSTLMGGIGQFLAKTKQSRIKEEELENQRKTQEEEAAEKARKGELQEFYGSSLGNLDLGRSLFGPQIGVDGEQLANYTFKKYWENEDSQGQYHKDYLTRLKEAYSDERFSDPEFSKFFKDKLGYDWSQFSETLNNLNLDDPNLDYGQVYSKLGLGPQYDALNDSTAWENLQRQREQQQVDAERLLDSEGNPIEGIHNGIHYTRGLPSERAIDQQNRLWINGELFSGINEDDNLKYKDGSLFSGDDEEQGLRYKDGTLYTGVPEEEGYSFIDALNYPVYAKGKKYAARDFLSENAMNPDYSDITKETIQRVQSIYDKTIGKGGSLHDSFSSLWEENNLQTVPYTKDSKIHGDKTMEGAVNLTDNFSGFEPDGSTYNEAILVEKRKGSDDYGFPQVQYRYIDPTGQEHLGTIKPDPTRLNNYIFVDENGNKLKELGKISEQALRQVDEPIYKYGEDPEIQRQGYKAAFGNYAGQFKVGGKLIKKFQNSGVFNNLEVKKRDINTGEEYNLGTVLSNPDYEMTGADKAQLAALATDLTSLGFAFVPGANLGSAAAGGAASLANAGAEYSKTGNLGSTAWGLAGNLALDAATLLPVLGGGAKTFKVAKLIKKSAPFLSAAFGAAGLTASANALGKIVQGDHSAQNYRALASGLTSVMYGKNSLDRMRATTTKGGVTTVKVNGKDVTLELDKRELQKLNDLDGKAKVDFLKDKAVKSNPKITKEDVDLDFTDSKFGLNPLKWRTSKDNFKITKQEGLVTADDANWFNRRAAKRYAIANQAEPGADTWLGGYMAKRSPGMYGPKGRVVSSDEKSIGSFTLTGTLGNKLKRGLSKSEALNKVSSFTPKSKFSPKFSQPVKEKMKSFFLQQEPMKALPAPKYETPYSYGLGTTPLAKTSEPLKTKTSLPSANTFQDLENMKRSGVLGASSDIRSADNFRSVLYPRSKVDPFRTVDVSGKGFSGKARRKYFMNNKIAGSLSQGQITEIRNKLFKGKAGSLIMDKILRKGTDIPTKSGQKTISKYTKAFPKDTPTSKAIEKLIKNASEAYVKGNKGVTIEFKEGGKIPKFQASGIFAHRRTKWNLPQIAETPNYHYGNWGGGGTSNSASTSTFPSRSNIMTNQPAQTSPNNRVNVEAIKSPDIFGNAFTNKINNIGLASNKVKKDVTLNNPNSGNPKGSVSIDPTALSEFGRALYNRHMSGQVDTSVPVNMLSHAQEIYNPVKGDIFGRNNMDKAANRIRKIGDSNLTSDAALNSAMRLSSNVQAEEMETQGANLDTQARMQQEAQNTEAARQYAGARAQVANTNSDRMANRDYGVLEKENAKMLARAGSIDNFWAHQNMRKQMDSDRNFQYQERLNMLEASDQPFGEDAPNANWQGKTVNQLKNNLLNEINRIYSLPPEQQALPENQQKLAALREESNLLQQEGQKLGLRSMMAMGKPGNITLNLGGLGNKLNNMGIYKRGGRLSKNDRMEINAFTLSAQNKRSWVSDYNRWMQMKMNKQDKERAANKKSIDEIVKLALNKTP